MLFYYLTIQIHDIKVKTPLVMGTSLRTYLRGCGGADEVRLVGHLDVPGARVGLGVDGDGGDAEPLGRAHDAAGDLAAVGDQQLSKCIGRNQ